jgi:hypothetical protein
VDTKPETSLLDDADAAFLADLLVSVKSASTVAIGQKVADAPANSTGVSLVRPGGRSCYPAFWIRDFAMSLASGCIPNQEMLDALLLTASCQCEETRTLPTGGIIPAGAIPDHINFDGTPIFYPGTYDPERQGGEPWGILPSLDDHFYFIEMAWECVSATGDIDVLRRVVKGKELIQRLADAFAVPPRDSGSGLIRCTTENRGVSFGFTDTVVHTGELLFCSLLASRAARHLAKLYAALGAEEKAAEHSSLHDKLRGIIPQTFMCADGYLKSSTGLSSQADVWGTAFAAYEDLLTPAARSAASEAILTGYRKGAIAWRGNIRHVPTTHDYSKDSSWERTTGVPINTYQNGAYWATATGWVADTLARRDSRAASELMAEYVSDLRSTDFRMGEEHGSPWECMHPANEHRQNPVYLTSVSCPVAALHRQKER